MRREVIGKSTFLLVHFCVGNTKKPRANQKDNVSYGHFRLFVKRSSGARSSDEVAKPDVPSDGDCGQALPPHNVGIWW